jgi:hypothetical protein
MSEPAPVIDTPEPPQWAKSVVWLWHYSQKHREALMRPPVLLAFVIIGVSAYFYGASKNSEQLGIKDERINFLNDQLAAYKDRLQGATPDQAAKQMAILQTELEAYMKKFDTMFPEGTRTLKDDQLKALASRKDQMLKFGKPLEVYTGVIGDSTPYAKEFVDFFKSQNIPVSGPSNFPCYTGERGVLIGLKDPANPSDDAKAFRKILTDAGIHTSPTLWGLPARADSLDFDLYICPSF